MKISRATVMLGVSVLTGLVAVVIAARWLVGQGNSQDQVVVAARDLEFGASLNATMVQALPWPRGQMPRGAIGDPRQLEGRVLRAPLQRGEPVLESKLAPVGATGGLGAVIPSGRRAITVKVNEVVGVAGFALPGNYVDVLVSTQDDGQRQVSKIVLERILVLAVAQQATRDDAKPKVVNAVTLEVTPEQAERLDLARSVGNLSLVLRNQVDAAPVVTVGIRKADLLARNDAAPAIEAQPAPVHPRRPSERVVLREPANVAPPPERVEVIRGVAKSSTGF